MPDGDRIIAAKTMGAAGAKVVSLRTGEEILKFDTIKESVRRIAVSYDGLLVAFANQNRNVFVCDPDTGSIIHKLKANNDSEVSGLAFAPGAHTLVHSSWGGITIFDTDAGAVQGSLEVKAETNRPPMFLAIAFSASGLHLATTRRVFTQFINTGLSVFEWPSGNECEVVEFGRSSDFKANQLKFGPLDNSIFCKISNGAIDMMPWDAPHDPPESIVDDSFSDGDSHHASFDISSDGALLVYVRDETLGIWDLPTRHLIGKWRLSEKKLYATRVNFSADNRYLGVDFIYDGAYVYEVAALIKSAS